MFTNSIPVTADDFVNRQDELARLSEAVRQLKKGKPKWFAVIGVRKIGKTSLIMELARTTRDQSVVFVMLDIFETMPVSAEFFRRYAIRAVDRMLSPAIGESLERLARDPAAYRRLLQSHPSYILFPSDLRSDLLDIVDAPANAELHRLCLDIPNRLAEALKIHLVVAIDEFQELASLNTQRKGVDPFPLIRSVWQKHNRVAYIISGSERTMLTELVSAPNAPFFQHFSTMEIGPLPEEEAVNLLVSQSPKGKRITKALARRAVAAIGSHPFYVQLIGDEMTEQPSPINVRSLKAALQELLFSRTGRLALYFEHNFQRLVGRSTYLARTLEVLAVGGQRLSDIAKQIDATTGATVRYLERLGDAVQHKAGLYELFDPAFGLWVKWRSPGGTVTPMSIVGDEAEKDVARNLSRHGFDLVYQSLGSRGAFDLLATRGSDQLGIQVKRSPLPLRFKKSEWNRMVADAEKFNWKWVIAAVSSKGDVRLLDPDRCKSGREVRLDETAEIENLLLWLVA